MYHISIWKKILSIADRFKVILKDQYSQNLSLVLYHIIQFFICIILNLFDVSALF